MTTTLKPYPAYKDSGVPWLGEVPEHWEMRKLRQMLDRVTQRNSPHLPLLSVVREKGVILRDTSCLEENRNFIPDDLSNYKVVRNGQFAMNKMKAWQGSYGVSKYGGIVSPAYFVFDLRAVDGQFFHTAIRSHAYVPSFTQASDGVRIGQWDLSELRMREIPFAVPSRPEQAAIVRFLDHADRRVKRYILAKQKLIKLLEEQKQAIIHRAVTRGLDPNVRLKPSGVEWLGDVPEHWEVTQIRSVAQVVRGGSPRPAGSSLYFNGTAVPWITVGEITKTSGMYLLETSTRLTAAGAERSRMIEAGTLLLTNSGATLGVPKISMIQGCINDGVAAFFKLRSRVNKEFLCLYWSTQTTHLKAWVDLGAQPNLNTQIIGGWPVPLPPNEEQEAIVQYIHHEAALLVDTTERAEREISLLREYRTRLIADVVTGKLDVRVVAAKLPDEPDESESLDDADSLIGEDDNSEDVDLDAVTEEAEA